MLYKEEDWSSESDEGAREDALDAAGLGDVRDVYQVQPRNSFAFLKHFVFRWTSQATNSPPCRENCSTKCSMSLRGRGSRTLGP